VAVSVQRVRRAGVAMFAVFVTIALVAACAPEDDGAEHAGEGVAGTTTTAFDVEARPSTPARLQILSPVPNQRTGADVVVRMRLDGARIALPRDGATVRGDRGHIHISLDGQVIAMPTTLRVPLPTLEPGPHTVSAEFAASDHEPFRNRVIATVTFEVR
jgi:hypothetical protein